MPGMVSRILVPVTILGAVALPNARAAQATNITTDLYADSWEGWGVSLAWWAKAFGDRDDLADVVFTRNSTYWEPGNQTLPGLGLNIVRYNAGACSWNTINGSVTMSASPNIPATKQIEGYWLDGLSTDPRSSSWNWTVDASQRAMMLKAQDRGANIFELFSNSPMWWQLNNHNPSGADDGGSNLPSQLGVTFDSIEPFNEPSSNWWKASGTQEGCYIGASAQKSIVPILYEQMKTRNLDKTIISASDENSYQLALSSWNTIGRSIQEANIGRMNTHGYSGSSGPRDDLQTLARGVGQKVWDSEYGDNDESGDTMTKNIILDLRILKPDAWVQWQILDGSGWGLISADISSGTLNGATHKYYELAHFTRHIRPGMQLLETNSTNVVAAIDQSSHTLVIVAANWDGQETFEFDLSAFSKIPGDGTKIRGWKTDRVGDSLYSSFGNIAVQNERISTSFENGTIQTLEIDGVYL
ncbi:Endo-beta-1-6-galactanase [Penicillium argentinense]|uniref:Endo-beta-1-6-galactanase n=1 Tax=Penicillium argentinense TaxID=1131581 RepID=A0A9W9FNN1_9EURO|nr:Endo-beta-1-6-galactanase [Penicillium argentinense]KAJ5103525.1 Endo-beta-1-6-galactanase [Penicillium argentinense]